jgi:outer membrane protein
MKSSKYLLAAGALLALVASPALAYEAGTWVLRGGVGVVAPKSGNLDIGSLDLGGGIQLTSASVEVDDGTSLTLMGTYMFSPNWAFDILASWPFEHDIDVAATIDDGVNAPVSGTVPLGSTKHLPPTFSIQYHFLPDATFQPYLGAGVNWTTFMSEEVTSDASAAGIAGLSLDDSFGLALQLGADWGFGNNWLINFDLRWINIETDASVTLDDGFNPPVTGEIGTVEIDPWVYSLNVGYRF